MNVREHAFQAFVELKGREPTPSELARVIEMMPRHVLAECLAIARHLASAGYTYAKPRRPTLPIKYDPEPVE